MSRTSTSKRIGLHAPGQARGLLAPPPTFALLLTLLFLVTLPASLFANAVTSGSATPLYRSKYAFGAVRSGADPGTIGFAGARKLGSTGLYFLRNRVYDPQLGRFLSRDPAGDVEGGNRYAYAGGNPIAFLDPLGLATVERLEIVGSGAPFRPFDFGNAVNPAYESSDSAIRERERSQLGAFGGMSMRNEPYARYNIEYRGFYSGGKDCPATLRTITEPKVFGEPVIPGYGELAYYESHPAQATDFSKSPLRIIDSPGCFGAQPLSGLLRYLKSGRLWEVLSERVSDGLLGCSRTEVWGAFSREPVLDSLSLRCRARESRLCLCL